MDRNDRRPHRPLINFDAVMLAIETGANCPCKLAALFDVGILHPDLVHTLKDLTKMRFIRGDAFKHSTPGGFTCTLIVICETADGSR
jgi:hypothetical protein